MPTMTMTAPMTTLRNGVPIDLVFGGIGDRPSPRRSTTVVSGAGSDESARRSAISAWHRLGTPQAGA